ncbi:cytochrome c oxidase subunit I [Terriglobus tenax]|uniref:cytochrome c oxidase subunit I n=1 Tax=Terriglobus tenax TaxID=1111115 RepID=UPI0021E01D40|nr:cbb3-type cytochrome c oxidase subunit I [Terriglobus tenax]
MSTAAISPDLVSEKEARAQRTNYLNATHGIKSWLLTVDHKRIALLYLMGVSFFFLVGGLLAMVIRMELLTPDADLMAMDTYNKVFTMHGVVMVFFVLIPAVPAVIGNFVLPMMLGARDLAFPKINLLSWYLYMIAGLLLVVTVVNGGVDTGWTFTAPLSTRFVNTNVITAGLAAFVAGFSSILTGLNFIVTIHRMRAPGLTWFRLPLFVWANYSASIIMILGTPVVSVTIIMVAVERLFHFGFFDPTMGGDPVLFQHLFWFYSHPAVYVMLLPSMGIISEIIACFSRKRPFGYTAVAFSSVSIAVFGFFVWEHHMFIMGVSQYSALVFSLLTMLVAVPSAIKSFNWSATLYKGSIEFKAPMIYALGFLGLFVVGGCTGIFLGNLGTDIHLTETYFVVAHFHFVMVGAVIMGYLGGLHFWWPKITGRLYPETPAKIAAALVFIGFFFTFGPQFILGYLGMPRRYAMYPAEWTVLNVMSTAGATVMGAGYMLAAAYLIWSLKWGKVAGDNPWNAYGLEWETQSPPLTENFLRTPTVTHEAYDYEWIDSQKRSTATEPELI